jgi:hypothetical protein
MSVIIIEAVKYLHSYTSKVIRDRRNALQQTVDAENLTGFTFFVLLLDDFLFFGFFPKK